MGKIISITDNKIFQRIYKKAPYFVTPYYVVYVSKRRPFKDEKRLGITAGKKVGNAVVRSRCRRIIRVIYSRNMDIIPTGTDIVIVARSGIEKQNAVLLADKFQEYYETFRKRKR